MRGPVERGAGFDARGRDAAHHLRRVDRRPVLATRIDALGREAEEEVLARLEVAVFERGQDDLRRRAGVRRALEDDDHAGVDELGDLLRRGDDVRDVGVARLPERRRDADRDAVAAGEEAEVGRRRDEALLDERGEPAVGDVLDVGRAGVDAVGDALVHVDAYDLEARLGEDDGEREADVAEADDAHAGRLVVDAGEEALEGFGRVSRGHGAGWKERKRGVGT